jgi:hypothetical protein
MSGRTYEAELATMPPGLDRAVLRVLNFHRGKAQAIGRFALLTEVKRMGFKKTTERQLRETIKQLRRDGPLICSTPGKNGGYYMAATLKEFDEFDQSELSARIVDLSETRAAMRKSAAAEFGQATQLGLL